MMTIEALRESIEIFFPNLWQPIEAALATILALTLKDVVNPPTCIFTGGPSSGKTTVLETVSSVKKVTYRSDKFTAKAFVSHAANVPRNRLSEIDLLPRIRHRALVTPELAPIFRGKEEALRETFAILDAVLDGRGYTSDSGTQGQRGYTGDYLFAWLGGTTPLPPHAWEVMGQLGSRLLFFTMSDDEVTDDELDEALTGVPYRDRINVCQVTVRHFLRERFREYGDVRGVVWDRAGDPEPVRYRIRQLARLLARLRSMVPPGEGWAVDDPAYRPPDTEQPFRALTTLYNLARGRALVYNRRQLAAEDLPLVAHVALSSMPHHRAKLVRALARHGGEITTRQAAAALGMSLPAARPKMKEMAARGIGTMIGSDEQGWRLTLRPEWRWLLDLDKWGTDTGPSSFQGGEGETEVCVPGGESQEEVCVSAEPPRGTNPFEGYDQGGITEVDVWED